MKIERGSVIIKNLRVHAYHGVLEQEHKVGNDYVISLRAEYDMTKACVSDDVNDALNYASLCNEVLALMKDTSALLERVAYKIGDRLINKFPQIKTITINLIKVNPPMGVDSDGAGVEIHLINEKTR